MRTLRPWFLLFLACGSLSPPMTASLPTGLVCDRVLIPPVSLADTLATAAPGDCVILPSGTYSGTFVLPEDVSLAASAGATVNLADGDPVLTIRGGERSVVQGIRIIAGEGGGIAIEPGPAKLIGVGVTQSKKNALTATCTRPDCEQREVTITDCEFTQNAVGVRAKGAKVKLVGGRIAEQSGTSLSAGSGVVGSDGARISMSGVTIDGNENIGVLLDGPATRANLDTCTVTNNRGRGVWAQGQTSDGGTTISITGGEISGNRLVGIGARDMSGLSVRGVLVKDTAAVRVPIDISHFEDVGDGIGLFARTNAVLEDVTLQGNARAQLLADEPGADVQLRNPTLSGGKFRVVVQHANAPVQIATSFIDDAGVALLVQSTAIGLLP